MSEEHTEKAESLNPKLAVGKNNVEIGQPRIVTSARFIRDQRKIELAMPQRLCTFDNMAYDDAVFNSIDVTNLLVMISLAKGEFKAPKGSTKGAIAANFLNYCIRNMSHGTWTEAMNNACTDIQYGFSLLNMVTEKRKYGPFQGSYVLRKLSPRDQKSIYGWVWDEKTRELRGAVQKPSLISNRNTTIKQHNPNIGLQLLADPKFFLPEYPFMRSEQLLHFKYNPKNNNPEGDSPLLHCFDAWKEKELVQNYEVVGVSRDLAGAIVIRVPSELIEKGNNPTEFPNEAAEYTALQQDAADLHAGKTSFIVLSSDVDPATKIQDYDIQFKGIDGGGKQYKTSDIIDQKRKSIYNVFGTGFLLVGQGDTGNYNIADNKTSTHEPYTQRNILWKIDVINHSLAPKLLAINNVFLDWKDMPKFVPGSPTAGDIDSMSKAIQRMKSVGGLTRPALEAIYDRLELPLEGMEELIFTDGDNSRGGESNGTSGVGDTQAGGSSSETNSENSVGKALRIDYETDDQLVVIDDTGKPIFIDKEE